MSVTILKSIYQDIHHRETRNMCHLETEVFKGQGQTKSLAPGIRPQAVRVEPMSAIVEDARSNSGLVRRGAIKRKGTKETTSSQTLTDRSNLDKVPSRRFSFDEHRHPSVRFAVPPANIGGHRGTGQKNTPHPATAAGKPQRAMSGRVDDHPPTNFDQILGENVPHPESQSKMKKTARLISKLRF